MLWAYCAVSSRHKHAAICFYVLQLETSVGLRLMRAINFYLLTYGLDRQHQDVDRTLRGRVNQNDR